MAQGRAAAASVAAAEAGRPRRSRVKRGVLLLVPVPQLNRGKLLVAVDIGLVELFVEPAPPAAEASPLSAPVVPVSNTFRMKC